MQAKDIPLHYNAVEILAHNLAQRADKTAVFHPARNLTFQQLAAEANQVGNALKRCGVRPGEVVALLTLDSPEWVASFFGTLKIGAVSAGLNTLLKTADYGYILHDCRARVLIVHASLLPEVAPILDQLPLLKHCVVVGEAKDNDNSNTQRINSRRQLPSRPSPTKQGNNLVGEGRLGNRWAAVSTAGYAVTYQDWLANEPTELETAVTHRDDYATLNYSSGTTGQPKGILHAHKDLPLIADYWGKQTLGLRESDRTFAAAKLFFTYGTGGNLLFPFYVGASIVLYSGKPSNTPNLLKTIERFRPTIFYNAPTGYAIALSLPNFEQTYDLSSLRLCVSGGENLPAPIWQQWQARTGLEIINGVGCTEVYHNFLSNRPDDICPGASGKPVPGFELRLVDSAGNEVAEGEVGNLLVKGDTIALAYLHQYERSRRTFLGEWFSTGDQFRRDEQGYYWHNGRSDDMLKVGGIWVSPIEVESCLIHHPAVVECAVVAWRDPDNLIKPQAYVVLQDPAAASDALAQALIDHCRQQLAPYKRPRRIQFVTTLPKTATGKIQRFKLRREIERLRD